MKEIYNNNKSFYQKSILKLLFPEDITLMDFINPRDSKYLYNSKNSYVSGDVCFLNIDNPTWYKCKSDTSGIFDSSKWSKVCTTDLSGAINEAKEYFDQKLNELIGNAPEALDTLNELAAALGNDANFSTTVLNKIAEKANADHNHDGKYLPLAGGTLTGDLIIDNALVTIDGELDVNGSINAGDIFASTNISSPKLIEGIKPLEEKYLQLNGGTMEEDAFVIFNGSTAINTGLKLLTSNSINSAILYPGELYIEKTYESCIRYSYNTITGSQLVGNGYNYHNFELNYNGITFRFNEETNHEDLYSKLTNSYLHISDEGSMKESLINIHGIYGKSESTGWRMVLKDGLEIAVAKSGNIPIVLRQYNDFTNTGINGFGTINHELTLLDSSGNSQFPGVVTINGLKFTDGNLPYYRGTTQSYILDSINSKNFGVPFVWTGSVDSNGKPVGLATGQTCMILES